MTISGIFYFISILAFIVVTHELGHLLSAKLFKVYCKEFSFGLGPLLLSHKGKETQYSLRLVPLGGFVSMAGEYKTDESIPLERTLKGIHPLPKVIIMLSGVASNFFFAWLMMVFINAVVLNSFFQGFQQGTSMFIVNVKLIYGALGQMAQGIGLDQATGPVGLVTITEQQANLGYLNLIYLASIISLNVAVFNALPLPILDGGRVVIIFIETLLKRPINNRVMKLLFNINIILLVGLIVLVMWHDVAKYFF